jgi:superfamily II DNA or RNA helicase
MPIQLHPYQSRAALWLAPKRRGLVVSSAGSGKTVMAAAALAQSLADGYLVEGDHVGWQANTLEQVSQHEKAVACFPELAQLKIKAACAAAEENWSDCEVLIIDEVQHLSPQGIWLTQAQTCKGAIWGFTATPDLGDPERYQWLLNFFNRQVFTVSREDCAHAIAKAKVVLVDANEPDMGWMQGKIDSLFQRRKAWHAKIKSGISDGELWARIAWGVCVEDGIVNNQRRNEAVIELAKRHAQDPTLILVNQIEHGHRLAEQVPGARLCFSKMGVKKRREALEGFAAGNIKCLISTSLADEGLDLPMIRVLILVSGGRSNAKTEQRTGRALRIMQEKNQGTIYDFEDFGFAMMRKHAMARQALYKKLGYEIMREEIDQPELAV